jgi:hypothetical protein
MSTPVTTANTTLAIQMPYIAASASCLNQLAQSLNSYPTTDICGNKINTAVAIAAFLNNQSDQNSYNTMSTAITSWLSQKTSDKTGPFLALGLKPEWNTNKCFQYGIRVQVLFANGYTVYDSNSNTNNQFGNINVPRTTFLADGKWLINENQATRSYNMGATLSNNGIF